MAVTLLSVGALVSTACASTRINRILAESVSIQGPPGPRVRLGRRQLLVRQSGAYRLGDESGQLWVVSDRGVPRKGARVTVEGTIREGFNLGSLGDRVNLPAIGSGLVLMESSHKAGK